MKGKWVRTGNLEHPGAWCLLEQKHPVDFGEVLA